MLDIKVVDTGYGESEDVIISGVILSEPYQMKIPIVDNNGNQVYEYNAWFINLGFPIDKSGELIIRPLHIWDDSIRSGIGIAEAKEGIMDREKLEWTSY